MNTQEILSIVALSLLGLCLLCGLAKMAMKGDSAKKNCDKACSMAVFAAVVLLAISQLIGGGTEKYGPYTCTLNDGNCEIPLKADTYPCGFGECNNDSNCCDSTAPNSCPPHHLPCCSLCCNDTTTVSKGCADN